MVANTAPWTAWVQMSNASEDYFCGGFVLDSNRVATAAHCLYDSTGTAFSADRMHVTLGFSAWDTKTWFTKPQPGDAQQDRSVVAIQIHPGYVNTPGARSDAALVDDVAVLTLKDPLDLSTPAVQAVGLPDPLSTPAVGQTVATAGFGRVSQGGSPDGLLHSLSLSVVDAWAATDATSALWVAARSDGGSTCVGDSGSAVTSALTGRVVGVVSHAPDCSAGTTNVFANVTAPEILEFLKGNPSPPLAPRGGDDVGIISDGSAVEGALLTCVPGTWSNAPAFAYKFVDAASGAVLGTSSTYRVVAADAGRTVRCEVSATTAGGTASAPSGSLTIGTMAPGFEMSGKRVVRKKHQGISLVVKNTSGETQRGVRLCVSVPRSLRVGSASLPFTSTKKGQTACWTKPSLTNGGLLRVVFFPRKNPKSTSVAITASVGADMAAPVSQGLTVKFKKSKKSGK